MDLNIEVCNLAGTKIFFYDKVKQEKKGPK
jgi:hypothetical protein